MKFSSHSTLKLRKRQRTVEEGLVCPVTFPGARKSSRVMRALAMLGLGLGGVSAGDDEEIRGIR